jgi:hypothetical protein
MTSARDLATDVDRPLRDHDAIARAALQRWMPRTSLRAYQRLAGGNVVLRDVVDLMVGTTASVEASVVLLDVTTSPLGESAERVMRYHALVQTLRTSVAPLAHVDVLHGDRRPLERWTSMTSCSREASTRCSTSSRSLERAMTTLTHRRNSSRN